MRPKTLALVLLAALAFVSALIEKLTHQSPDAFTTFTLFQLVAALALIFWWYHVDKAEQGYRAGRLMNAGMLLVVVVALPIYLFRSRGWKRGARATALAAAMFGFIGLLEQAADLLGGWLAS